MIATPTGRQLVSYGCWSLIAGAGALGAFFGCAEQGSLADEQPPPASTVPDRPAEIVDVNEAGADASVDAGCDAGDRNCTPHVLSCAETAWCPEASGVDARYALAAIWGTSATDVWAVGAAGSNVHWDGVKWTAMPSVTPYTLRAVVGTGPDDIWAVSSPSVIFHMTGTDAGAPTWQRVAAAADGAVINSNVLTRTVWAKNEDVLIGGDLFSPPAGIGKPKTYVQEWQTKRSPIAWSTLPGFDTVNVYALWGEDPDTLWAVGYSTNRGGVAYRRLPSTDGGVAGWEETDIQTSNGLTAVWGTSPSDVWAVGSRGTIRHWSGKAWQIVDSGTTTELRAVWGSGPADVWVAGDYGTLIHWNGSKWEATTAAFPVGIKPHIYGLWGSSPSAVWAVGQDGTILRFSGSIPAPKGDDR